MDDDPTTPCTRCSREVRLTLNECAFCGTSAGYFNVRRAGLPEEKACLEAKYHKVLSLGNPVVKKYESAIKEKSQAVVNVKLRFLHNFLVEKTGPYSTYDLQVQGETRWPAKYQDAHKRKSVDTIFFGPDNKNIESIRFAALSLDGRGLISYGPFAMQLSQDAIGHRASLTRENTYKLADKYKKKIPPGLRAVWEDRHKLAVAKLGKNFDASIKKVDFPGLLLKSDGDRKHDEFIEVHIYGGFDHRVVTSVCGDSQLEDNLERAYLMAVKDRMRQEDKEWVEV